MERPYFKSYLKSLVFKCLFLLKPTLKVLLIIDKSTAVILFNNSKEIELYPRVT